MRAGPFSDERIIRLANRRFVAYYFDLSNRGAAGDPQARTFVVRARKRLGGFSVPTPPVLFMNTEGKVLAEVSNYATPDQVLSTMLKVLKKYPMHNKQTKAEEAEKSVVCKAEIYFDLHQYDRALQLLEKEKSSKAYYLTGRIHRLRKNWNQMAASFKKIDDKTYQNDIRMEQAYKLWNKKQYERLFKHLANFPKTHPRYNEARYYEGLAYYHLGKKAKALETWKQTIQNSKEDRWIYRADWAYTACQQGKKRVFSTLDKKISLLGRHGYMGRKNPDLEPQ